MKKIGITTTVPVEVIFAAGFIPVDLNNVFITNNDAIKCIDFAESHGFPRNTCAWIKGIYSSVINDEEIDTVIGVIEGDCSNTKALIEVLKHNKINCIPFSFPSSREYNDLKKEIEKFCRYFDVNIDDCNNVKNELDIIRKKTIYLDELTWKYNKASGFDNHIWQVSCSDFNGNPDVFHKQLENKIQEIEHRPSSERGIRLGYIGVPPINTDIYEFTSSLCADIVYNEVQRQFAIISGIGNNDIVESYLEYTYPYSLDFRLQDIKKQIEIRKLDGLIHYTQSFCYKGIEDIVIKKELNLPILTLEGDRPGLLDARTKLRIEAFIDMIRSQNK